jgi:hypothetical protein
MKSRIRLLMTIALLAGLHQAAAQVSFAPAVNYGVGKSPYCVIAADVNGDGKVDLISANEQANTLTVLTNDGSGMFGSNATYNVSFNPYSLVTADVNGDGKVDLISVNIDAAGTLTVLTNNGSGKFVRASSPGAGTYPRSIVKVDINGDGLVDLIVSGGNISNPLTLLTNAGNGIFIAGSTLPSPPVLGSSWFAVSADVNGDGKPDLIDLDSGNSGTFSHLRILTNNGNGTFTLSSTNALATTWPGSLTAVDVNGNGKVALIVSDYASGDGNTLEMLTNNGAGIFGSNATYTVGGGPQSVIAADVNGDGKVDLISANYFGTLTVLTNNGNGGFGSNTTLNVGPLTLSVVAADVNDDGKLDLVSANEGVNTLSVLINNSTFPPPTSTPALNINHSGKGILVSWPSASAGWSLQQRPDLTTGSWSPSGYSGYPIADDGTNKSLTMPPIPRNLFFRLLHP